MELENDTRPEESPYARETCHIRFQNDKTLFVYRDLLDQSPKLVAKFEDAGNFSTLILDDIHSSIGHVLVHFLTTGTYQCLRPQGDTAQSRCASEFATALRAHAAATSLELPALVELAKGEIERLGEKFPLPSVVDILEGSGLGLGELPEIATYLESRIQSICEGSEDVALDGSLHQMETPDTISKFLLRSVLRMKKAQMEEIAEEKPLSPEERLVLEEENEITALLAKKKNFRKLGRRDRSRLQRLEKNAAGRAEMRATEEAVKEEEEQLASLLTRKAKKGKLTRMDHERLVVLLLGYDLPASHWKPSSLDWQVAAASGGMRGWFAGGSCG